MCKKSKTNITMDALQNYASNSDDSSTNEKEDADEILDKSKAEVDEAENISDITACDSCDFFGLFSKDLSKSRVKMELKTDTVVSKSVKVNDELVNVDIPDSSFWNDLPVDELQNLQNSAQYDGKTVDNPRKLYKTKSFQRPDIKAHQKRLAESRCSHRDQSEEKKLKFPCTSNTGYGDNKPTEKVTKEKRKLFFIHPKINPLLFSQKLHCKIPTKQEWHNPGHAGATNRLKWNIPNYSHLLVTCSMDSSIKIWNIWSQLDPCVQLLHVHSKAVRDVAWNQDGRQLLSCSYDKSAVITDVEKGVSITRFEHSHYVACCTYHPVNHHICVTGIQNQIQAWDCRTPAHPCRMFTYKDTIGQVQDIVFISDGSTLFSCSDFVSRDSSDRNLMAWDFGSGVVLSNQIYQERFTLSRLKLHPTENQLLAQSNGNYIALFSLQRPYKMNKHKRFEGHKLQGYNVGFDVSPDGQTVYSGGADGKLYCYNYPSGKQLRAISTGVQVVMDVACHPLLSSTVGVSSWDGTVEVWR